MIWGLPLGCFLIPWGPGEAERSTFEYVSLLLPQYLGATTHGSMLGISTKGTVDKTKNIEAPL